MKQFSRFMPQTKLNYARVKRVDEPKLPPSKQTAFGGCPKVASYDMLGK